MKNNRRQMTSRNLCAALRRFFAQNSDCIGWLSIPDTQLNTL